MPSEARLISSFPPRRVRCILAHFHPFNTTLKLRARVTRHRNRDEIRIEIDGVFARNDLFDPKSLSAIVSMHYALTVESIGKASMIRDIVFVREKHRADATHRFDPLHELGRKSRRVD